MFIDFNPVTVYAYIQASATRVDFHQPSAVMHSLCGSRIQNFSCSRKYQITAQSDMMALGKNDWAILKPFSSFYKSEDRLVHEDFSLAFCSTSFTVWELPGRRPYKLNMPNPFSLMTITGLFRQEPSDSFELTHR